MNEAQSQVLVLAPVREGQEDRLRDLLRQLPGGEASPFGALGPPGPPPSRGRTHFARFVVIDRLDLEPEHPDPDRLSGPFLLFSAVVDGRADSYLEALWRGMGPDLAAVWRCCADYADYEQEGRLACYFKRHRIGVAYLFPGHHDGVDQVRHALADRQRMIEFAQKPSTWGALTDGAASGPYSRLGATRPAKGRKGDHTRAGDAGTGGPGQHPGRVPARLRVQLQAGRVRGPALPGAGPGRGGGQ